MYFNEFLFYVKCIVHSIALISRPIVIYTKSMVYPDNGPICRNIFSPPIIQSKCDLLTFVLKTTKIEQKIKHI